MDNWCATASNQPGENGACQGTVEDVISADRLRRGTARQNTKQIARNRCYCHRSGRSPFHRPGKRVKSHSPEWIHARADGAKTLPRNIGHEQAAERRSHRATGCRGMAQLLRRHRNRKYIAVSGRPHRCRQLAPCHRPQTVPGRHLVQWLQGKFLTSYPVAVPPACSKLKFS